MTATALQKTSMVERLKEQNERLKNELKVLTEKLEEFVQKAKVSKQSKVDHKKRAVEEDNEVIKAKKAELAKIQNKIKSYNKEIANMRRQLEGSYNIDKIIGLEDEVKDKERVLRELQTENESLISVQKEQEKALKSMKRDFELDGKVDELNGELKLAKEKLRKVSVIKVRLNL